MKGDATAHLARRWASELSALGAATAGIAQAWEQLAAAYGAPDRHYHNLAHIAEVLGTVDRLAGLAFDVTAVRLAAWYHDIVYEPGAQDNEARSAACARAALGMLGQAARADAVARLILLTAAHRPAAGDADGRLLVDADLAILGAMPSVYDRYATAIRHEYGHVPAAAYRQGRTAVLRALLARRQIYQTEQMAYEREAMARRNLRRELEALASGEDDPEDRRRADDDQ